MRKTRKIPIILSSIVLGMGSLGGSLPMMALEGVSPADVSMTDKISLTKNEPGTYLTIDTVRYKEGGASGTVSIPEEGDWYIKKIVVAQMNFGQGVTEEQADENLAELTGVRSNDWVYLSLYDYRSPIMNKEMSFSLNQTTKLINAYTNKSDILYYAVEFATAADDMQWGEGSWWSRGKIDYRNCVHSAVFDEDTMVCKRMEGDDGVRYIPQIKSSGDLVMPPENEKVLEWREEWKDVIILSYEAVQNESELMLNYMNLGLTILDQNDLILDGIMKSVAHYSPVESKLVWIPQGVAFWKAKIEELRNFYGKSSDTSESDVLREENATLRTENAALVQENGVLKAEKMELETKNTELIEKSVELEMENVIWGQQFEAVEKERAELEKEILKLQAEKIALEMRNRDLEKAVDSLSLEKQRLEAEKEEVVQEKELAEAENSRLREENEAMDRLNAELVDQLAKAQESQKMTDGQNCSVGSEVTDVNSDDGSMEEMTSSQISEAQVGEVEEKIEQDADEDDLNVPVLGGEEVKTTGMWWILIPVIGAVGMLIWATRRKFSRE